MFEGNGIQLPNAFVAFEAFRQAIAERNYQPDIVVFVEPDVDRDPRLGRPRKGRIRGSTLGALYHSYYNRDLSRGWVPVSRRFHYAERYRSGRNGGASKASCRVTGTWVRIPPSPPTIQPKFIR
jgi:hypothetical protein